MLWNSSGVKVGLSVQFSVQVWRAGHWQRRLVICGVHLVSVAGPPNFSLDHRDSKDPQDFDVITTVRNGRGLGGYVLILMTHSHTHTTYTNGVTAQRNYFTIHTKCWTTVLNSSHEIFIRYGCSVRSLCSHQVLTGSTFEYATNLWMWWYQSSTFQCGKSMLSTFQYGDTSHQPFSIVIPVTNLSVWWYHLVTL